MDTITCSLVDCEQPLLGTVVMLAPEGDARASMEWGKGFNTYINLLPDGEYLHYVILHQVCFLKMFNELFRQHLMTALTLLVGPIGLLAEEMGIPH